MPIGWVPATARRSFVLDAVIVLVLAGMTESVVWSTNSIGDRLAGPRWVTAGLPLLVDLPLLWRRRRPLLVTALVVCGMLVQIAAGGHSAEGLETIGAVGVASYSVAAYCDRRRAVVGLAVLAGWYAVYAIEDRNIRTGRPSELWAGAFFALAILVTWLVGAFVRSRRESLASVGRAAAVERQAAAAVAAERGRLARELHDVVAHNLSVVVLQAAGARAQGDRGAADVAGTLAKIEDSGREAMGEMRRLLDVLRADDDAAGLLPQPGLDRLDGLVDGVRRAGLPVDLAVSGDRLRVPPLVGLSAYRIVQEALTNTLKHAGPAHATVRIDVGPDAVLIGVTDDGRGADGGQAAGHGLIGMRERVTLLGGELHVCQPIRGGFDVRACLPFGQP